MSNWYWDKAVQEDLDVGTGTSSVHNPGGGTLTGTQIGLHSFAVGQLKTEYESLADVSIAIGSSAEIDVTVSGAAVGDFAIASFNVDMQGLNVSAHVTAANTVTVAISNNTSAIIVLSTPTVYVLVFKSA
jgi:hypothetical protein